MNLLGQWQLSYSFLVVVVLQYTSSASLALDHQLNYIKTELFNIVNIEISVKR